MRENMHQMRLARKLVKADGVSLEEGLSATQVDERRRKEPAQPDVDDETALDNLDHRPGDREGLSIDIVHRRDQAQQDCHLPAHADHPHR